MDISAFSSAIDEIAQTKGLTREAVVEALRESIKKAYLKYLGGGDDAMVEVTIDSITNEINCRQLKKVVKDVQDDYLEIDIDEANEGRKKKDYYKEGDLYPIECPVEDMSKVFAKAVQNNFRSKLAEAERFALYDIYKDSIGEMITGVVEKADERSVFVNIGRTTVELTRREMIGDEFFRIGDPIKVYIQEVKSANDEGKGRGPQIEVTRSSEGFLRRLFEEEIHEIFDGTVIIKGIAREAGIRSKVAVTSKIEDVDATGACIGPGGSRIQKIVSQLGNGKDKEKIDVIAWSANPGLFIAEALRPAQVLGVSIEEQEEGARPSAIAIVRDEQLSLAIGKKGANARLANKLTGWNIEIIEESIAKEDGIEYETVEDLMKRAEEEAKLAERAAYAKKSQEEAAAKSPIKEEEITFKEVPESDEEEIVVQEAPVVEEKAEAAETKEEVKPVEPTLEVKTTTTMAELEQELEKAKSRPAKAESKSKRPRKITEEEVQHAKPSEVTPAAGAMPIYSQEELDEIEAEENALAEEENDYNIDDEDYDEYYDED